MAAESVKPTAPTVKKRRRIQHTRRSDAGSTRFNSRDANILRFGAEQTFARADSLGEHLAPGHTPALALPPPAQLADPTASVKRAWPADLRHRLMAVSHVLRKLKARGEVEIIQPWADQPAWYRVTGAGLRVLSLNWPDILFPAKYEDLEARLRHDRQFKSHTHLINQVRLLLARGGAGAPMHIWKGERAIENELPPRETGVRRPHKPDGILYLKADGAWSVATRDGAILATVEMKAGQLTGIEVECTLKSDYRLSEILPDLLAHHEYVWYFCLTSTIKQAVAKARLEALMTDEQRRRVRILLLEDFLPCP
ncbi:MAG: hypothetical protein ACYDER_20725 [Ktedonobacteraceae bacterium]